MQAIVQTVLQKMGTLSQPLLALNHDRYAEEVAQGLHDKKKPKATKKAKATPTPKADKIQGSLF